MKIDITEDLKYLICSSDYPYEMTILKRFLTREIEQAWIVKKMHSTANTERCFLNAYGMAPTGLWAEIMRFAKENNIYCEMSDRFKEYLNQFVFDYDSFKAYVDKLFEGAQRYDDKGVPHTFAPREYQIKAAYSLLKYRKCCGEISTSAGKTLIAFIIFRWLVDNAGSKKILYIVPNAELAVQSAEKYELYQSYLKNNEKNWQIGILKAGLNKKQKKAVESCNILFGTYQSLCHRSVGFFTEFVGCIQDECLHPDTLITMGDGSQKRIAEVQPGENVYTYNELEHKQEILPVKKVYKNLSKHEKMYEITFEDGTSLKITGNHKVFTTNRGYVRVDELTENDDVVKI